VSLSRKIFTYFLRAASPSPAGSETAIVYDCNFPSIATTIRGVIEQPLGSGTLFDVFKHGAIFRRQLELDDRGTIFIYI
jgi:hypothetical protein